jgi:phosphoglycolate phosphatase
MKASLAGLQGLVGDLLDEPIPGETGMNHVAIFDLDGTLVDTPRAIVETIADTFAHLGATPKDKAAIRGTIGLPIAQAFGMLLGVGSDDSLVKSGIKYYQALFKERVLPMAQEMVFPGVADGLAVLRAEGFTLAIATSKFHASADALLEAAGLRNLFTLVIGADQVTNPKPHPETGHVILQKLGVSAEHAVMVGDTTHDLRMAKAAGMRSVGVTYGIHNREELSLAEPNWIADTFIEVRDYIQSGLLQRS